MGGDLNLKKSWHPNLRKNQETVWKAQQAALAERKVVDKLRRERQEERAVEELQRLQESAGKAPVQKRVDWMYNNPANPSGDAVTEERESYLLGTRRIDHLLTANDAETSALKKGAVGIEAIGDGFAGTARDTARKVAEDPLLLIQKSKMEAQIKAFRDQQKMAQAKERADKGKERRHRHRRRRSRSRSRDDDHDRRHRHRRSRSRSRDDDHDRSRRHRRSRSRDDDYDRRHRHRRSRSRSRDDDYDKKDRHRRRSRSPRRSDAAERLARMQADASSLDKQREERVRLREAEDAAEEAKFKKDKFGSHRFVSKMNRERADMAGSGLGDAMARDRRRGIDA
ncbi:hypothetical protein EJ04DRAFT_570205 [Polyplosphaeria fusca]|uniref:CBF1-interacting co-repressor CIR N-terminal domain-containing protein n=1 Tax=Polyplosphaeria fusca TaxID=682080 RepID=A0A9P4QJW5_9PLEO|nr:hypothetical protein EJ04DRAFT_570205 [Polyplosphaeria fusca]